MSTSNSINYALGVINKINNVKRTLRSAAVSSEKILAEIDTAISDTDKKSILADGLQGLSVNAADLKTEKTKLSTACQSVLDNVEELTE